MVADTGVHLHAAARAGHQAVEGEGEADGRPEVFRQLCRRELLPDEEVHIGAVAARDRSARASL